MNVRKTAGARVTTRTGDRGATGLFGPGRVPKTDARIVALGDLDEAQAALGVARALARGAAAATILDLQRGLYRAMAEVATPRARTGRLAERIDPAAVAALDELGVRLRARTAVAAAFVVPGESPLEAALDHARAVVRRAERSAVAIERAKLIDGSSLLPWLNRLSDVLYLLARASERRARAARGARS